MALPLANNGTGTARVLVFQIRTIHLQSVATDDRLQNIMSLYDGRPGWSGQMHLNIVHKPGAVITTCCCVRLHSLFASHIDDP